MVFALIAAPAPWRDVFRFVLLCSFATCPYQGIQDTCPSTLVVLTRRQQPSTFWQRTTHLKVGVHRGRAPVVADGEVHSHWVGEAGLFDSRATDADIWDGHDGGATLSALTIDPRAHLIMAVLPSTMLMERHNSAVVFIGQLPAQIPAAALWPCHRYGIDGAGNRSTPIPMWRMW